MGVFTTSSAYFYYQKSIFAFLGLRDPKILAVDFIYLGWIWDTQFRLQERIGIRNSDFRRELGYAIPTSGENWDNVIPS